MQEKPIIVIGLGVTGQSVLRFFASKQQSLIACDTRKQLELSKLKQLYPNIEFHLGSLSSALLTQARQLIVSPGVSCNEPAIQAAMKAGVEVIGDVELFLRHNSRPVVAITGSNGKTTVTSLVGAMAQAAGENVAVAGNIGTPVLDLLNQDFSLFVLELSSFQLETIHSLKARAAVLLNISADHLDRHRSMQEYLKVKQRIYQHADCCVINLDQPQCWQDVKFDKRVIGFCLSKPVNVPNYCELVSSSEISVLDDTNYFDFQRANILAAWCIGKAVGFDTTAMLQAINNFEGLPHRFQIVVEHNGVTWINDSKATNVGATLSALESLAKSNNGKIILLAGGDAKQADMSELAKPIRAFCKAVIVMGKDADKIAAIVSDDVTVCRVDSLQDAVDKAATLAQSGDAVLLSPACASTDMFANYIERGEQFIAAVQKVTNERKHHIG